MKKIMILITVVLLSIILFLSGCLNESSGVKVVPIRGILEQANINEKVIVRGYWYEWDNMQQISDDTGFLYAHVHEGVDTYSIDPNIKYAFTCIIRYGKLAEHGNDEMIYLEVLSYQPL
jgi:uncharacterized lipoprotein YajG